MDELLELLYQEADYPRMQDYAMKALALEPAHPKIYAWAYISMEQQHLHKIAQETLENAKMNLMEAEYAELMHLIGEISEEKKQNELIENEPSPETTSNRYQTGMKNDMDMVRKRNEAEAK